MRMKKKLKEDSRLYTMTDDIRKYSRTQGKSDLQPKCCITADERQMDWDLMMTMVIR